MAKKPPNKKSPAEIARERARRRGGQQQTAVDDYRRQLMALLAQMNQGPSPADLMRQARGLYPGFGGGSIMGPQQMRRRARMDVNSIMGPQLAEIRRLYKERSADMSQAHGYYFGQFADRLGGYASDLERTAKAGVDSQQVANQAMADYLSGKGMELAGGVAEAMRGIDAPQGTLDATAGSLGALATGAAGQTYALGGSATDLMRGEAENAAIFARKQPFRAQQEGAERLLAEQRLLNKGMEEDIGALEARLPELMMGRLDAYGDDNLALQQLRANRSQALLGFLGEAQTGQFNRLTAGSAILRDLLTNASGLEQTYAGLETDLVPGPGAGGTGAGEDGAAGVSRGEKFDFIYGKISNHPFFQDGQDGLGRYIPSKARQNPRQARKIIRAMIDGQFPAMPPKNKVSMVLTILRALQIPILAPPRKPGPQPPPGVQGPRVLPPGKPGQQPPPGVRGPSTDPYR